MKTYSILVLVVIILLAGNFVKASTFVYEDDFETDKAKYESWDHSPFADIGLDGYLHYETGLSGRGLGFHRGCEVGGTDAYLVYATIPQSAVSIGGSVQFFIKGLVGEGRIRIYGSPDGVGWILLGTATGWPPNYYSMPIRIGDPVRFLMLLSEDHTVIDNLEIRIEDIPESRYSGGTGEPNDPYRIASAEDLNDIGNYEEDWDKHFVLVNDVNLAGYTSERFKIIGKWINWNDPNNKPFTGVFDGNEKSIWNFTLTSDRRNCVGLFGYIGNSGQIKNLGLENVDINDINSVYIGGLVGFNQGSIINCFLSGSVKGYHNVGGLVGTNDAGTITNCCSRCSILGSGWNVGGLVGANDTGIITDCSYTGDILGGSNVGGLVGDNDTGTIRDCHSAGSVSGGRNGYTIGGLVGYNDGEIMRCYSTGSVDGNIPVGGLVGHSDGTIMNCYSTCSVSGGYIIGGLVGWNNEGYTAKCCSTGSVSGTGWNVGGLIGFNDPDEGFVRDSFWDIETSGQSTSSGGTGKTTAEMKTMSTFTEAGWDFDTVWWMPPGNYPRLICQRLYSGGGSGTQEDQYILKTVADWQKLMDTPGDWDKHFILMADIDLQGVALSPVGNWIRPFIGVFDGKGHIIRKANLNMPDNDYVGLFGYVSWNAQIQNLGVRDVTITGNNLVGGLVGWNEGNLIDCYTIGSVNGIMSVGGLVGDNSADLTDCYATCSVSGIEFIGGLVGHSDEDCNLTACYATGPVKGSGYCIGGLVGLNHSNLAVCYATGPVDGNGVVGGLAGSDGEEGCITDCYSTGPVRGIFYVGGLAGYNGEHSSITNCYATGLVDGNEVVGGLLAYNNEGGSITACFWDVNTTSQNTSIGGKGKATTQMKTLSTFASAGWNFVEVWGIGENQTYPFLRTEPAGDLNHDKKVDLVDLAILALHWLEGP